MSHHTPHDPSTHDPARRGRTADGPAPDEVRTTGRVPDEEYERALGDGSTMSDSVREDLERVERLLGAGGSVDAGEPADVDSRSGRHPVSVGHLVMGLAFLCFVGAWALVQADVVGGDDIRWLLPVPWIVAGAVGLAVTAASSARRRRRA